MSEEVNESQKTVVAFIGGLLVGALLVWMFGLTPDEDKVNDADHNNNDAVEEVTDKDTTDTEATDEEATSTDEETATLEVGEAVVRVAGVKAGSTLALESVTFPTDAGWVAVRSYNNETLGSVLGASRYSKEQGLVPTSVALLSPMITGQKYALVFFSENGDRQFNMRSDIMLDTEPIVFTAE